jgi:hypothetical protein
MKILTSSTPVLRPVSIYNSATGEAIPYSELQKKLDALGSLVQKEAQAILIRKWNQLVVDCKGYSKTSPAEFARQKGYNPDITSFPAEVKAKSRVQKLIGHSLISTVAAHVANPNPRKQQPHIGKILNLGAGDKQLSSLSYDDGLLTLLFKCYDTEYLLEFQLPSFVTKRHIVKWCLPTIALSKEEMVFRFPYQEQVMTNKDNRLRAGIDIGRVEPYTLAVINSLGNRVAHYTSSKRLTSITRKRDRLLAEKRNILAKISVHNELGLDTQVLELEAIRKSDKAVRLGTNIEQLTGGEVARKLQKHQLRVLNMENLKWVTGTKYGSRWNHSKQQDSIQHALLRQGTRSQRINPKNTSQLCHNCDERLVHNAKNRTVWCAHCKTQLDRDYNAAMNIAKNKNKNAYPRPRGVAGIVVGESQAMSSSSGNSSGEPNAITNLRRQHPGELLYPSIP